MSGRCGHWREGAYCGEAPTRLYPAGRRCAVHTPSALQGRPEPAADPAGTLAALLARAGRATIGGPARTVVDDRAIASGKRRAKPRAYQEAVNREKARRAAR